MAHLELIKGQRLKLSDLSIDDYNFEVGINIEGINYILFFCLVFDSNRKLLDKNCVINTKSYILQCSQIPQNASEIIFIIDIGELNEYQNETSNNIKEGSFFITKDNIKLVNYSFNYSHFNGEKTLILAKIYKKDGLRLAISGDGFRGGLLSCLQNFKIPESLISDIINNYRERKPDNIDNNSVPIENILLPKDWPGFVIPEIPQGLTSAVGFIIVETVDGKQYSGTGFVINPGGYILTCCHVVKNAKSIRICLEGTNFFRPLKCLAQDEINDVALFWLEDCQGWPYWLPIINQNEKINLGEPLGLLGYPLSFELGTSVTYTQGIVNSCRMKDANIPILQIDAGAAPGSSGGPVFRRKDGRVVGILQGGIEHYGMFVNLAWDIRAVYKLISTIIV
ncbi:MAG: trypsin-like peptidase domain-containing protein [Desulfamplus sp.]|nr:trypsin-like peptidase domain-containing protein [Desulfamplus sp.]